MPEPRGDGAPCAAPTYTVHGTWGHGLARLRECVNAAGEGMLNERWAPEGWRLVDERTNAIVFSDDLEPEDVSMRRGLSALVTLLNHEASEVARLRAEVERHGAALTSVTRALAAADVTPHERLPTRDAALVAWRYIYSEGMAPDPDSMLVDAPGIWEQHLDSLAEMLRRVGFERDWCEHCDEPLQKPDEERTKLYELWNLLESRINPEGLVDDALRYLQEPVAETDALVEELTRLARLCMADAEAVDRGYVRYAGEFEDAIKSRAGVGKRALERCGIPLPSSPYAAEAE